LKIHLSFFLFRDQIINLHFCQEQLPKAGFVGYKGNEVISRLLAKFKANF